MCRLPAIGGYYLPIIETGSNCVAMGDRSRTRERWDIRRCIGRIHADHLDHPGDVDDAHIYSDIHVAIPISANDPSSAGPL